MKDGPRGFSEENGNRRVAEVTVPEGRIVLRQGRDDVEMIDDPEVRDVPGGQEVGKSPIAHPR